MPKFFHMVELHCNLYRISYRRYQYLSSHIQWFHKEFVNLSFTYAEALGCCLKLYCRYEYTKPCMINRIWGLKQLWLQVNGHAWFHLQRLRWPVRNGQGANNSKWKYMSGLETYFFSHSQTFASGFNLNSQIAVCNSQLVFPTFEQFLTLRCGMAIASWG